MIIIPNHDLPKVHTFSHFQNSKFLELKSNDFLEVCMAYPAMGMCHAEQQCLVRTEVYEHLLIAKKFLPKGYKLKIWDAWRPFSLQKELFNVYSMNIVKEFNLENCSDEQKNDFIKKFVSVPIADTDIPPVHTTGGAIDVTLTYDGVDIDMGTSFDEFTPKTYTTYYENSDNFLIKQNRRLLYFIMSKSGFTNLPSEWWHFDYGDRFWAYYNKLPTIYNGVFEKKDISI